MNVLVLSDNLPLLQRAKPIFMRHTGARFLFTDSDAINPKLDFKHITDHFQLVISLHCKKLFPSEVYDKVRCVNIHPGFNPYNRGMFPHVWSIINGLPAGATIHEIDYTIDEGPIIAQKLVHVLQADTSDTLYARVVDAELELLDVYLETIVGGSYATFSPDFRGNYNSIEAYNDLCNVGDMPEHLFNRLRALSHTPHWNATYNGLKIKLDIKH